MVKRVFLMVVLVVAALPVHVFAQESDWLPAPTGPFAVGTVTYHWIDETRDEMFTSETADKREIIVRFWYPAIVEVGATPELYLNNDPAMQMAIGYFADRVQWIMPPDELSATPTHAYANAPLSDAQETFPVLVFTHGWGNLAEYYTVLLEEVASQGYIVAGITHPYASAVVTLDDGRIADFVFDNRMGADSSAADQIYVLDQLAKLNVDDPEGQFVGRLDLSRIGVFGHSMGGVAAIRTCMADNRCQAALNLDADSTFMENNYFVELSPEESTLPILFLVSNSWGQPDFDFFERTSGPAYYLTFDEILHNDITDFPLWFEPANMPDVMMTDFDPQRSWEIITAYTVAFFDHHLKGEEASLLTGPSSAYTEIEFLSRN